MFLLFLVFYYIFLVLMLVWLEMQISRRVVVHEPLVLSHYSKDINGLVALSIHR